MTASLLISFPDQSHSFTHGVELGRILQMIESGQAVINNKGIPVHTENVAVLRDTCNVYGYTPSFSEVAGMAEWTNFFAVKTGSGAN